MAAEYVTSLLDPFDSTVQQPKIYDGSEPVSSGLRFRTTGNFSLNGTGADNFAVLIPGFSQGLSWMTADTALTPTPYPSYVGTPALKAAVRRTRIVSSGLRLQLMNSADDNEGYWEAIRIPLDAIAWQDQTAPEGEDFIVRLSSFDFGNFSNYSSYQTGALRDLYRYQFKLNSVAPDHPFQNPGHPLYQTFDPSFDVVVIRMVGRVDAVAPSIIMYNHVSNQEVVFKNDTIMHRLATPNKMVPEMGVLLDRTRYQYPAVQIA